MVSMIKKLFRVQNPHNTPNKWAWLGNFMPNVKKLIFNIFETMSDQHEIWGDLRPPTRHRGWSYKSVRKIQDGGWQPSWTVAALAIDKVGPTIFVRALPRALPLGQEAKKVKSP